VEELEKLSLSIFTIDIQIKERAITKQNDRLQMESVILFYYRDERLYKTYFLMISLDASCPLSFFTTIATTLSSLVALRPSML